MFPSGFLNGSPVFYQRTAIDKNPDREMDRQTPRPLPGGCGGPCINVEAVWTRERVCEIVQCHLNFTDNQIFRPLFMSCCCLIQYAVLWGFLLSGYPAVCFFIYTFYLRVCQPLYLCCFLLLPVWFCCLSIYYFFYLSISLGICFFLAFFFSSVTCLIFPAYQFTVPGFQFLYLLVFLFF